MSKNNIVLYQPEIPQNTGNVMRTCAGTDTTLHLIKPLGFSLDEKNIRRSAANYVPNVHYIVYENWEEFLEKNPGGKKGQSHCEAKRNYLCLSNGKVF